jgi:hypothetical protein
MINIVALFMSVSFCRSNVGVAHDDDLVRVITMIKTLRRNDDKASDNNYFDALHGNFLQSLLVSIQKHFRIGFS